MGDSRFHFNTSTPGYEVSSPQKNEDDKAHLLFSLIKETK